METTRVILMSKDNLINFTVSPLHLVLWLSESVVLLSFSDWLCHHCGDPALLLPSFLLLDVSWGSPAVPHACRSLWERILAEKVLLRVWLPLPCHRCRRLSSYWLQELRDQESVSAASFFSLSLKTFLEMQSRHAGCCTVSAYLLWLRVADFEKKSARHFFQHLMCIPGDYTKTFERLLPGMGSCSIFYVIWKWLTDSTLWFQGRLQLH